MATGSGLKKAGSRVKSIRNVLKSLDMPALERPVINRLMAVQLPAENSPFTPMEEMMYENLFGSRKDRHLAEYDKLESHKYRVFNRLSTADIVGKSAFDPPYPDISPGTRRIEQVRQMAKDYDLLLITEQLGLKPNDSLVRQKYAKRKVMRNNLVKSVAIGEDAAAALWTLDRPHPLDYWRQGGITQFEHIHDKLHDKRLLLFGFKDGSVSGEIINAALKKSEEELQVTMAVMHPRLFGGPDAFKRLLENVTSPWKLDSIGEQQTNLLKELARIDLTKGSIGPGPRVYLTKALTN